jgi:hypothetical protein
MTPPNGLVKIGRETAHGFVDEYLEYEQTWEDTARNEFVMKAYDKDANIVYVRINKNTAMEAIGGFDIGADAPPPPLPDDAP